MRNLIALVIAACAPSIVVAGMFSWTDSTGNVVFGDKPPQGVAAKPLNPPKLTVLEGFANRYQGDEVERPVNKAIPKKVASTQAIPAFYKKLTVIAPKQGQAIRANDGDVSAALSISPKLRSGDQIVFSLDGKEIQTGTSKVTNMANLDRGEHTLNVSIIDKRSRKLISSDEIKFVVLRAVAKKEPLNPYDLEGASSQ